MFIGYQLRDCSLGSVYMHMYSGNKKKRNKHLNTATAGFIVMYSMAVNRGKRRRKPMNLPRACIDQEPRVEPAARPQHHGLYKPLQKAHMFVLQVSGCAYHQWQHPHTVHDQHMNHDIQYIYVSYDRHFLTLPQPQLP